MIAIMSAWPFIPIRSPPIVSCFLVFAASMVGIAEETSSTASRGSAPAVSRSRLAIVVAASP